MRKDKIRISPRSAIALELQKGDCLKVICPEGQQVADLVAFNARDIRESLSNGKTFDYEERLRLTKGSKLYSNQSKIMLEITEDSCGIHDFLLAPCCTVTMQHFYNMNGDPPNCLDNLFQALQSRGIEKSHIPTAFNIFMNVEVDDQLNIRVKPPKAVAGDHVQFMAHMDLLLGISACSAGASNDYSFGPIDIEVTPGS